MILFIITYFLCLVYLSANHEKLARRETLRVAWRWFAIIPFFQFGFAMCRAGNHVSPTNLLLVEYWADGLSWLLIGFSMCFLIFALFPRVSKPERFGPANPAMVNPPLSYDSESDEGMIDGTGELDEGDGDEGDWTEYRL